MSSCHSVRKGSALPGRRARRLILAGLIFLLAGPAMAWPAPEPAAIGRPATIARIAETQAGDPVPLKPEATRNPTAPTVTRSAETRPEPRQAPEDPDMTGARQSSTLAREKLKAATASQFIIYTIIFAAIFVALFSAMQLFGKANGDFPKYFVVFMVITASILLLVMGYTETQIAPAFGLLGTILGYIFGRSDAGKPGAVPAGGDPPAPERSTNTGAPAPGPSEEERARKASEDQAAAGSPSDTPKPGTSGAKG